MGHSGLHLGEGGGFFAQKFNKIPIVEPYKKFN
jgi:hypothetical protein